MAFLRGKQSIQAALVNHTGTMIRFRPSQLRYLPQNDTDCLITLLDGRIVKGKFHLHPANPYIGGPGLVRWIKTWVEWRELLNIHVDQVGTNMNIKLRTSSTTAMPNRSISIVKRKIEQIGRIKDLRQRRKEYKVWERNPNLRKAVLQVWPSVCQVDGCRSADGIPDVLKDRILDVHHIDYIARRGSDSPTNLCLIARLITLSCIEPRYPVVGAMALSK